MEMNAQMVSNLRIRIIVVKIIMLRRYVEWKQSSLG